MGFFGAIKSWIATMKFQKRFRNPISFFAHNWAGECWECESNTHTFFKVRNGMPKDVINETFKYLPKHELRDEINELNYLFYMGYKMWNRERLDARLNESLDTIRKLITDKFDEYKEEPEIEEFMRDWEVTIEKQQ